VCSQVVSEELLAYTHTRTQKGAQAHSEAHMHTPYTQNISERKRFGKEGSTAGGTAVPRQLITRTNYFPKQFHVEKLREKATCLKYGGTRL
jgi:hypothetical protein